MKPAKPYKHYILTRFNFGVYTPGNPYAATVSDPEKWMAHRIRLFEEYCLPSLQAQTCRDYTWVLAFDFNTPPEYITRYDYIDNVKVVFEQPHLWLRAQEPESEWLLTSRLDNDDMYMPEFVERVQMEFRWIEEIVDIDYIALHRKTGKRYESGRLRPNSPFLSVYEKWEAAPLTALGRPHTIMPEMFPARKIETLAIQLIHSRNVCNKINGKEI